MKTHIYIGVFAFIALVSNKNLQAQDLGTKVIDVVKAYSPTIADAVKSREEAPNNDSLVLTRKKINYTIYSVPVASTFVPEKGKASRVIRQSATSYNNSYAGFGGGNYGTLLGDAYVHISLDRENSAYIAGEHYSSQGGIKDVTVKDNFSLSDLEVGYQHSSRDMEWGILANAQHRLYNWYGIKPDTYSPTTIKEELNDTQHFFFDAGLGGYFGTKGIFRRMDVSTNVMADGYKSMEIQVDASPVLFFDLDDDYGITLETNIGYLKGNFEKNFEQTQKIDYNWLNVSATPSFILNQDIFSLRLGGTIAYVMGESKTEPYITKEDKSHIKFYPNIEGSIRLMDDLAIVYAGADGNTQINSYRMLSQQNPYVSPTLSIRPTFNTYTAFGGIKGNLDDFGYNLKLFYGGIEQIPMFVGNLMNITTSKEKYHYHNSFETIYDNGKLFGVKGELEGNISQIFFFNAAVTYQNYEMKNIKFASNIPNILLNINTDCKIIGDWFAGVNLSYTGERKMYDYNNGILGISSKILNLKPYFLLDFHTDYTLNKKWTIFARANNLLNQTYESWIYYPSQGLQILGGIKYQFKN